MGQVPPEELAKLGIGYRVGKSISKDSLALHCCTLLGRVGCARQSRHGPSATDTHALVPCQERHHWHDGLHVPPTIIDAPIYCYEEEYKEHGNF